MRELFESIGEADQIHIGVKQGNVMMFVNVPAEYWYDKANDTLVIGDDDNGIVLEKFEADYSVEYDDNEKDYLIESENCLLVLNT